MKTAAKPAMIAATKTLHRMKWCKVCRRRTAHTWIGQQQFPNETPLDLYDCAHCGATQSEEVDRGKHA